MSQMLRSGTGRRSEFYYYLLPTRSVCEDTLVGVLVS